MNIVDEEGATDDSDSRSVDHEGSSPLHGNALPVAAAVDHPCALCWSAEAMRAAPPPAGCSFTNWQFFPQFNIYNQSPPTNVTRGTLKFIGLFDSAGHVSLASINPRMAHSTHGRTMMRRSPPAWEPLLADTCYMARPRWRQ